MDLSEIKKNYEQFDDDQLRKIATEDMGSLRKEVLPILEEELAKRNINIAEEQLNAAKLKSEKKTNSATEEVSLNTKMLDFMNQFEIPHILKAGKAYYFKKLYLGIFAVIISLLYIPLLYAFVDGKPIHLIGLIPVAIVFYIALGKLGVGKIVEVLPDKVIVSQSPNNKLRLHFPILAALNGFKKVEINDRHLLKIAQKEGENENGFYLDVVDKLSNKAKHLRIPLELLSEYDSKQFIQVVELKIAKHKKETR